MAGRMELDDFVTGFGATLDEVRATTDRLAELSRVQRELEMKRATGMQLIARYARLHVPAGPGHACTERLEGVEAVRERLLAVTRGVREEVVSFCPGGAHPEEALEASRPQDEELLARGVRLRTLFTDSVRRDPVTVGYAQWLVSAGGQVRTAPALPLRMIVIDRETAFVPLVPHRSEVGAVVLHGAGPTAALLALFEQVWLEATPLDCPPQETEPGSDRQEREVLRLLAQGLTDEAVSARLGVSVRTTRRIVAKVMERLGARSRFQAGVMASRGDWL